MNYVSVCSGIEAATVAWHPLGWRAAAFSEIEPFPCAALAHHYPDVDNLGDMEAHAKWRIPNVDLLVGGTPCQSFSVAGLRKGMADPRGNLALVYLAIADQLRPEWLVWENVPGVLSSKCGRDFGAFLGGLGELGYRWAYRVLDAQYFGVPQRRRRVFVVGHSGSWQRAAAVLFELASLRGDSAPSREAREGVALPLTSRVDRGGEHREDHGNNLIAHTLSGEGCDAGEDGTGRGTPLVTAPLMAGHDRGENASRESLLVACFDETQITHRENRSTAALGSASLARGARAPATAFQGRGSNIDLGQEVTGTIGENCDRASGSAPCIAFRSDASREGIAKSMSPDAEGRERLRDPGFNVYEELAPTVDANQPHGVLSRSAVRRLTPRECERLQGFPDDYTLIPFRGKPASDTARYRAIGNSMAVPVMRWIGERIAAVISGDSGR